MEEWVRKKIIAQKAIMPIILDCKMTHQSGIYAYERQDENGIKFFYVGQAVDIYNRQITHYNGYDRIDLSIKKRKWKTFENPYGWTFKIVEYCSLNDLNEKERYYIKKYIEDGKVPYNKTIGGQDEGKTGLNENKSSRGYYDGKRQGYEDARKYCYKMFEKYLLVCKQKTNALCDRKYNEFIDWLKGETSDEN